MKLIMWFLNLIRIIKCEKCDSFFHIDGLYSDNVGRCRCIRGDYHNHIVCGGFFCDEYKENLYDK